MNHWIWILTGAYSQNFFLMFSHSWYRERSWVKLIDVNRRVVANRVVDHLQSRLVYFLMNMHIKKRNIYICRHGESECNMLGQIGGDSDLSPRGKEV